jgi:hypothetical protein
MSISYARVNKIPVPFIQFMKTKSSERQYYTYFDWNVANVNRFLSMFGEGFADASRAAIRDGEELRQGVDAFIALGKLRNELVHQNFAMFGVERTAAEIDALYRQAVVFVDFFPTKLREACGGMC